MLLSPKTKAERILHDLNCKNAEDMYSKVLSERVRELKETQEGVEIMCKEMDKIYHEGEKRGEARGRALGMAEGEMKAKKETTITLAEMGVSIEKIAQAVKVSMDLVQEWLTVNNGIAN